MSAVAHPVRTTAAERAVRSRLVRSPVFDGLAPEALDTLAQAGRLQSYSALQEAIVEGEAPTRLHIVASGRFVVLLPSRQLPRFGDNAMISLDCFVPGDSFGEAALTGPAPASASIVATELSELVSFRPADVDEVIAADAAIGRIVYRNLFAIQTRRLASLTTRP